MLETDQKPYANSTKSGENWERDVLNRLAFATLNEQRRARRWGIFFKFLLFIYLFSFFFVINPEWSQIMGKSEDETNSSGSKHTALVEIKGVISAETDASADKIISGLRAAFEDKDTAGVIIRINSPGGSPVQAGYINDEIKRLRKKYTTIPLYAVVTDICASGGYYIAVAADKIYVDKASIIGSIGVLMNGFGFVDAMEKLGIERRLITAGEHKGFLDPFLPTKPEDVNHIKSLLDDVHNQFIDIVKKGRGERLKDKENPELFSGLVWSGEQSLKLGLADGLGSSSYVSREIIKAKKIVDYTTKPNYLDRFAERFGTASAAVLTEQLKLNSATLR